MRESHKSDLQNIFIENAHNFASSHRRCPGRKGVLLKFWPQACNSIKKEPASSTLKPILQVKLLSMVVRYSIKYHKNCSYSEATDHLSLVKCDYLHNNYGLRIVLFDDYGNGASTNDNENRRRKKE